MIFGIMGNVRKPSVRAVSEDLLVYLRKRKLRYIFHDELGSFLKQQKAIVETDVFVSVEELPRRCDVLISLGGDGTMLSAARIVGAAGVPIIGVNLGKLGFMAEISVSELRDCLDEFLAGKTIIEQRTILKADVRDGQESQSYFALNEIAIDRGLSPRVIRLQVTVDNQHFVTLSADGLIVATPTGSTAYSLASGGPIIAPRSGVFAITPISPHTLSARPIVVPDDSVIRVMIDEGLKPVHLAADGFEEQFYQIPAAFTIQKAPFVVKFVRRAGNSYFDVLRSKLKWGSDPRVELRE